MFQRIHYRLGTAGFIISIVALVAALGGGAYAASGALSGKQKKEVEKIAKKYAGKPGPTGPAGQTGANGKDGAAGKEGAEGKAGSNGISPIGTAFSGSQHGCAEGGVEVKGASTSFVCNGVKGANGQTGFTETLPAGKVLKGAWAASSVGGPGGVVTAISFNIPLEFLTTGEIHVLGVGETTTECPGSAANPEAVPSSGENAVCLYESFVAGVDTTIGHGVQPLALGPAGAVLSVVREAEDAVRIWGTYAVAAALP